MGKFGAYESVHDQYVRAALAPYKAKLAELEREDAAPRRGLNAAYHARLDRIDPPTTAELRRRLDAIDPPRKGTPARKEKPASGTGARYRAVVRGELRDGTPTEMTFLARSQAAADAAARAYVLRHGNEKRSADTVERR